MAASRSMQRRYMRCGCWLGSSCKELGTSASRWVVYSSIAELRPAAHPIGCSSRSRIERPSLRIRRSAEGLRLFGLLFPEPTDEPAAATPPQRSPAARYSERGCGCDRGGRMKEFGGKAAVVTGAASAIGLARSERFVAEGLRVVMADSA